MSNHEKESVENTEEEVVEETTEEPTEEPIEEPVDETDEEPTDEQEVDYDGELNIRKGQREHNKKGYEQRKSEKEDQYEEEGIEEKIRKVIREEHLANEAGNANDVLQDELEKIANSSERKLVEDYYNNTIQKSGTNRSAIIRDISLARTLANQPRIQRENSEMKIAVQNRSGMSDDNGGSNQDKPKSKVSKWSKEQLEDLAKRGLTAEEVEATMKKINNR